ncbi:response regulator transcription factor [Streptomyces chumphonensis]|uniref:Response regulator transcription factor n=1 Tax=Streptomyces chumphonensis TaxID=1214925 RepID=A0A927EW93_9ACTN|nr:response regulator transcription factor [Streptomyces chumphonensis]MBD3930530.1 response regulator transcription factor [Streptomyces chumphonensis]
MIRVLLVHDARLLRSGLAELLGKARDITATCTPWRSAERAARATRTDVCVADVDERNGESRDLTELMRHTSPPGCRLLVLATAGRPGPLRHAFEADALGFVNKDASPDQLLTAIRQVAAGERFVDPSLALGFLQASQLPLTQRELSVLSLAAEGASVAEIAASLHLTNGTVRNYMSAITRKTGARNRVDAICIAQRSGWL